MRNWLLLIMVLLSCKVMSQGIAGYVYDNENNPLPAARIQVKFFEDLNTVTDNSGRYYILTEPGIYDLVISSIGYETQEIKITVKGNSDVVRNIWLKPSDEELNPIMVKARKRDPAYEIIQNAIERKSINKRSVAAYSCDVYIRASEEVERKVKPEQEKDQKDKVIDQVEEKKLEIDQSNFAEINLKLDFQLPGDSKETRTGVKKYGDTRRMFYTTTTDARFSIYDNLISLKKVTETPQISPISRTAIVSYKYKLDSIIFMDKEMVYKIKVWPRKRGNATMSGYLWIQNKSYAVIKCDLLIKGGNSYRYDEFSFSQEYTKQDSLWLLSNQGFEYLIKNRNEKREGKTIASYNNYNLAPTFPKRYFSNELGVTTEEAYERDSSYWELIRPEPLTEEEQEFVRKQDSIYELHNSEVYLDSVDSAFNKVTLAKIAYFGVDHRNRDKRLQWGLGSIVDWFEPFEIAGARMGPNYYLFKKWENEKTLWSSGHADMGFRNGDVKGGIGATHLYNPFRVASIQGYFGHRFELINQYDAYINYIKRSNYIENTHYRIHHQIELMNGLYLVNDFEYDDRKPINEYKFGDWIDQYVEDNEPIEFERYQAFRTEVTLQYVFGQQYLREPHRKVILGSRGPTVYGYFEKGWNGLLWSDVDYEYLLFGIRQTFSLGTMGTSKYHVKSGRFIRQRDLRFVDLKFHRRSDRLLFSNALFSFQLLNDNYPTRDWYLEGHYIHHFNGALINFIPFVKKLKLQFVAGGGLLLLPEYDNFNYQELYFGVERVNKVLRRRLRLGFYYVMARSSDEGFLNGFKISFDILNERRNTWNF